MRMVERMLWKFVITYAFKSRYNDIRDIYFLKNFNGICKVLALLKNLSKPRYYGKSR